MSCVNEINFLWYFFSNTLWLVEYYLEWCGHCQDFAPTFKEFAHNISGKFLLYIHALHMRVFCGHYF